MTIRVRARYAEGMLTPLEPLEIEEGCEVVVTVDGVAETESAQHPDYPNYVSWILEEQARWPLEELGGAPSDLARNKKHYLYGYPKEADA